MSMDAWPAWQAFEREGKGSFEKGSLYRRERNARGARGRSRTLIPFPFPFERLPRRLMDAFLQEYPTNIFRKIDYTMS